MIRAWIDTPQLSSPLRSHLPGAPIVYAALVLALVAGCGPTSPGDGDTPDAASDVDGRMMGVDANTPPDARVIDAPPPPENAAVFAHTSSTLYRVDPETLAVESIGDFQWPLEADSMTDIAIDQFGRMTGVSFSRVYEVDETTGACTYLADLQGGQFNGLSFIPDPQNPNQDILVGADQNGDVYQLDPTTGAQTLLGNYGND